MQRRNAGKETMLENPMYLADPPEPEHCDYERSVDLKWSLWLRDKDDWECYAPGLWDWMRHWYEASTDDGNHESAGLVDAPRVLHTAPRKEIRFGEVKVSPGRMDVHFWAEWDNGRQFHCWATVEEETFEAAMHEVDHCEVEVIRACGDDRKLRCHDCGYPYKSPTSRFYRDDRWEAIKI